MADGAADGERLLVVEQGLLILTEVCLDDTDVAQVGALIAAVTDLAMDGYGLLEMVQGFLVTAQIILGLGHPRPWPGWTGPLPRRADRQARDGSPVRRWISNAC